MDSQTSNITIAIPHYKTLQLTQLCLRLLRKNSDLNQIKVIVIDNDSQDASSEWLSTLPWITLLTRKNIPGEPPQLSHGRALDLALAATTTPYFLSIHTDTLIKRPDWLSFLLQPFEADAQVAGVGSWKLENKLLPQRLLKSLEQQWQNRWYRLKGQEAILVRHRDRYLRSHCALYRVDLLRRLQLTFVAGHQPPGQKLHHQLEEAGYTMQFLPSETLSRYLDHINHATMVLNTEFDLKRRALVKGQRRIQRALKSLQADKILEETKWDQ